MLESSINNANKMLAYRIILCFTESDESECTITNMARKLNAEKYQVSRAVSALEQQELVEKNEKGQPRLTGQGERYARQFQQRVNMLVSFLLRTNLDPKYARDIALHIAGHADDAIMNVFGTQEVKMQVKDALMKKQRFTGSQFTSKMRNGSFPLPYVILVNRAQPASAFLSQSAGHSLILNVNEKKGTLQFRPEKDRIYDLKYFYEGEYLNAEKVGEMFFLPANALQFIQMGNAVSFGASFCGKMDISFKMNENGETEEHQGILEIVY